MTHDGYSTLEERIQGDLFGNFAGDLEDYADIAKVAADAAREYIAAERQATVPPTDAELAAIYNRAYLEAAEPHWQDFEDTEASCYAGEIAGIRAVRKALGAWPVVPEGWRLDNVTFRGWTNGYEASYRATVANDALNTKRIDVGPTPAAALQSAIDAIQ